MAFLNINILPCYAKTVPNIQLEATTLDEFNFTPSL